MSARAGKSGQFKRKIRFFYASVFIGKYVGIVLFFIKFLKRNVVCFGELFG